jgi:hypothetical protein
LGEERKKKNEWVGGGNEKNKKEVLINGYSENLQHKTINQKKIVEDI